MAPQAEDLAPGWHLTLDREDLTDARLGPASPPEPGPGEAVLRVDRVGMTANNVTYAVLGEAMRYWEFFPVDDADGSPRRGRVPLWGFADVVASRTDGVAEGARVYGYLPSSSHLLVRPDRVREGGAFRDAAEHRRSLPAVYNAYAPAQPERADLQVLFRPLFTTSFVLADWLAATEPRAEVAVLSSASSKTAYGTAFLLRDAGAEVVGLTSPGNVGFTENLGVYDRVLAYDDVTELGGVATAYLDVAGSAPLRRAIHAHLGADVVRDVVVGIAQGSAGEDPGPLEGARPSMFFAPDWIAKRQEDWGPGGLDDRLAEAWEAFADRAEGWVDVVEGHGPEALREAWLAVLDGVGPRVGHVVQL